MINIIRIKNYAGCSIYNMKIIAILFLTSIFALPAWSIEPIMQRQLTVYYNIPFAGAKNHSHRFGLRFDTIEKQNHTTLYRNHTNNSLSLLEIPINRDLFALQTSKYQYLTQSVAKTDTIGGQQYAQADQTTEAIETTETIEAIDTTETTEAIDTTETTEAIETTDATEATDAIEAIEESETALNISNQTAVGILLGGIIAAIAIIAGSGG